MTDREKHISVLQDIDRAYRTFTQEEYRALEYAIASLKTDEAYQLMYEGKEIYTKTDMVAMLKELKKEIEELDFFEGEEPINITQELMDEVKSWEYGVKDCKKLIQSKIDKLKEMKNEKR